MTDAPSPGRGTATGRDGGVQSLHRALDLLEVVAARGGQLDHRRDRRRHRAPAADHAPAAAHAGRPAATCGRCRTAATRSGSGWSRWAATASSMVGAGHRARCWPASSTRSARPPTSRCCPAPTRSTSPRCRRGTRCGCSPRSAGRSTCTAPASARRCSPSSTTTGSAAAGPPGRAAAHTEHTLVTEADSARRPARRSASAATPSTSRSRRTGSAASRCAVGPEPMSWMAVSVSGPVTRMTDDAGRPRRTAAARGRQPAGHRDARRVLKRAQSRRFLCDAARRREGPA